MDILLLKLDAPLMSFGAPVVDRHGKIQPYPAQSMMVGLIGNALGYDHSESEKLARLQECLLYACRQDKAGEALVDYQTVDLSQEFMRDDHAWTTQNKIEKREGGSAKTGTHVRYRHYWADAVFTVAVTLVHGCPVELSIDQLEHALACPERPLFIGRKTCLPSQPILRGRVKADSLFEALKNSAVSDRADPDKTSFRAWWPAGTSETGASGMSLPVTDRRDWENQIHVGERWINIGEISIEKRGAKK